MTASSGFTINDLSGISYLLFVAAIVAAGSGLLVAFNHYFTKYFLISFINKIFDRKRTGLGQIVYKNKLIHRIAYLVPAFIIYHFSYVFDFHYEHFSLLLSQMMESLSYIYILIGIALVISALLNCIYDRYNALPIAKQKPIKSYIQLAKIILFSITCVFVLAILFDKPPVYIFSGVGAAAAFFALIFKDSVLGFIASVQLSAYDMLRIGDWIEMPNFGADGEVIEISLNTVKVQNFDKTIVTIPSYALLTSGLKNWRGMQEAGGRRVKRSIIIDINRIKICDQALLTSLSHLSLMDEVRSEAATKNDILTNLGLFRLYLEKYLKQHPGVHKDMKIVIRQMQGTPTGMPLELYFFTTETDSIKYEAIQADIIEHAYALMPNFELRAFQYASDAVSS